MKLLPNWRAVAARAWSVRLLALSIVLSALEFALSAFMGAPPFGLPNRTFAALAFLVSIAAAVARLVAQKDVGGDR